MRILNSKTRFCAAFIVLASCFCPLGGVPSAFAQETNGGRGGGPSGRPQSNSDTSSAIPVPQAFPGVFSPQHGAAITGLPVVPLNTLVFTNLKSPVLLSDAVQFNTAMDKLMPCAGCADVNWRAFNQAIKAIKQLRLSLAAEVSNQRAVLAGHPSPEQLANTVKIIQVLERTTSALEGAAKAMQYLGKAFDTQR